MEHDNDTMEQEPSANPMGRVMMDGILHSLARRRKNDPDKSALSEGSGGGYIGKDIAETHHDTQEAQVPTETAKPPLTLPRKGILKPPTVRFAVADDPPSPPRPPAWDHSFPPPPPPPPPPPLSLFTPSIGKDEYLNEAAYRIYTKFMDELSEFVDMQGDIIRNRVIVQEKRQQLKLLRDEVSQCDMRFMDHVRQLLATGWDSSDAKVGDLFREAQAARDNVGPVEDEYEVLEIRLGAEEFGLKEKYSAIEHRFERFFRLTGSTSTALSAPSRIEFEESSIGSEPSGQPSKPEEPRQCDLFHGAFIGDEVAVGKHPIRTLANAETNNPPLGLTRSSDTTDHKWGPISPAPAVGQIGASSEEGSIEAWDVKLEGPRLDPVPAEALASIGNFLPIPDISSVFSEDSFTSCEPEDVSELLLIDEDSDTQSTLSEYLLTFDSTRDRVNRWMLHQLRISPREIYALRRRVLDSSPRIPDWSALVLRLWSTDGASSTRLYHDSSIADLTDRARDGFVPPYPPYPDVTPPHIRRKGKQKQGLGYI